MGYKPQAGEVNSESKGSVFDETFGSATTPAQGTVFEGGDLHTRGPQGPQGTQGIGINTVSGVIQPDGNTLVTVTFSNPSGGATPNPMTFTVDRGEQGEGADDAAHSIGFRPPTEEEKDGGEVDGAIILGDLSGDIISELPVDVRATSTIIAEDNGLVGIENGRLVLNVSTAVQAGDERPVNAAAVHAALSGFGPGDHITTSGSGDNVISVTTEDGNVTTINLGDDATARAAIGAQQQIDGVFFAATPAQIAADPPRGQLGFYADVDGTPTLESTQGLLVLGMRGFGTATHTFDNGTQLWFEVETVGGGGSDIVVTGDSGDNIVGITVDDDGNLTGVTRGTIQGGDPVDTEVVGVQPNGATFLEFAPVDPSGGVNFGSWQMRTDNTVTNEHTPVTSWDGWVTDNAVLYLDVGTTQDAVLSALHDGLGGSEATAATVFIKGDNGSAEVLAWHASGGTSDVQIAIASVTRQYGNAPSYGTLTISLTGEDVLTGTINTGGGASIPVTGTGNNIVGTTVSNGNLTGVALGTIQGGSGIEVLASDPASPTDGQVWYNSSQEIIKYFDGELILDVAKFLGYFSADPAFSSANHSDGDMWYNTASNEFKYFSGSGLVHTVITDQDSITALSDGQAVLDSIAAEATTRAEDDAAEIVAREAGDAAERDFVETTLHVDAADSQSYYQFSGQPAIFSEVPGTDYGVTIAMPETIEDTESLVQAENIGTTTKVFKLRLRFNDGANDTKEYVVTTGGYNFTISDERTSETFTLPTIEGTYVAASVHQNGTNTQRQNCFLAIGGWFGRIAQVDMAHVLDVSNGNILTGRTLEVGQDYSEHTVADNNNTAVVGLVFDNQTTGSHTGINAYVLQRHNRIVRYRAATSGGLFSFRNGNSVVDRFHPSRVPDVVSQQTVDESNWLGLKLVTIQNAISNTSASGQSNRLTFASGDKMLVAFGEAVDSASAGISIPGIAISKNPSTFAGGSVNLGLFYPGGNDPSEEYSDYSGATEANYNAHIYDMEYSNASGAWTFFFGGETVGATAIATRAAGFHGTSIWNMASISTATKAGAGGIIRSVNLGGNLDGLASSTHFWVTTELGALWINTTPWLASGYGDNALVQAHTNPNDPTSDIKRDFTFRGFQYFDQHGSIGAGDDGHIYRLVINPEVTLTVSFSGIAHTATFRFNDNTAAMHTFFATSSNYTPTLVGSGITLAIIQPTGEPNDQRYLDYSVNGQNTPVVSYQWVGVLSTTDDDFETYSPFRRIDLANTVVDIHYPDGGATYHIPLSSVTSVYPDGGEANEAVDQIVAAVNLHTAQGHSALRVDSGFADTITNTRPVLRLDQTGTHALQHAPEITINHPEGQNTGTLAVASFADGGYDTIGRPGGLFDPNDYDTRAELDAKIAAVASTHGYAENIVANAGNDSTTYTRLERLQIGTEIYDVEVDDSELQTAITGRLDNGANVATDSDDAYTTAQTDRLLGAKQNNLTAGTDYLVPPGDASNTNTGLLTSTDWITFNDKLGSLPADVVDSNSTVTVTTSSTDVSEVNASGNIIVNVNADLTPANGIYLDTEGAADEAIPKWNSTDGVWELGTDEGGMGSVTNNELERNTIAAYFAGVGIYLSDTAVEEDASSLSANEYYTGVTIRGPGLTITVPHAYFFDASINEANDNSWRETDSLTGTLLGYQGG